MARGARGRGLAGGAHTLAPRAARKPLSASLIVQPPLCRGSSTLSRRRGGGLSAPPFFQV